MLVFTIELMSPLWLRKEIAGELRRTIKMYCDVEDDKSTLADIKE